jgi:hypothetical protein
MFWWRLCERPRCGNISYAVYPNDEYGWGMPDVCAAGQRFLPSLVCGREEREIVAIE